ncbi:hypothetical protein DY000_02052700 [Brassica cretica]|uniref:Uncharacterized protein n=1 Tax=Brassica cretica TaxID=69181 RepID=A0ABQ7AK10_BRACR|nr:hypothetical protein DY000_02052700 [Brassica cretica]
MLSWLRVAHVPATGEMLHYSRGMPVASDEIFGSNVIHVHSASIEWAPQIYSEADTLRNLKAILARGLKIKIPTELCSLDKSLDVTKDLILCGYALSQSEKVSTKHLFLPQDNQETPSYVDIHTWFNVNRASANKKTNLHVALLFPSA